MTASLLPNFDELVELAKQDPQALEALRQQACEQLIASANPEDQRKLKGLQFKIEMERRRTRSHSATCLRLSEMMSHSFTQLKTLLSQTQDRLPHKTQTLPTPAVVEESTNYKNNIFPFPSH